jgi:NAD(P) transhydrogenase subunit beta
VDARFVAGAAVVLVASIASAILFMLGLRDLAHPRTARNGLSMIAIGLLVVIAATAMTSGFDVLLFFLALALGGAIGGVVAERIALRSSGSLLVAGIGFGGLASALVAGAALRDLVHLDTSDVYFQDSSFGAILIARAGVSLAILFGAAAFGGCAAAVGKLQGTTRPPSGGLASRQGIFALGAVALVLGVWFVFRPAPGAVDFALGVISFLFGFLLVPTMRADATVITALLVSAAGASVTACGFALHHNALLIGGALAASASFIFARFLARGVGRTLGDVALGGLGEAAAVEQSGDPYAGRVKSTSPEEVAMVLDGARRVVIVPGYGLAVSQGQHALRDLANLLRERGAAVDYAIHPVAGCMPGQMNLLLTEADVPYEEMKEIEDVEPAMAETDVALVVGANDIVNPEARTNPESPLAGLEPVIDVGRAGTVVVVKRGLAPGFAGVANPLFAAENALLLFGDGKKMLQELVRAVKENAR